MPNTMKMYFDVPSKQCTLCIEYEIGSILKEQAIANVSSMMKAPARCIDEREYNKLSKQYIDYEGN